MAWIQYNAPNGVPAEDDVPDQDHIIRVHEIHSSVMRQHYELYKELMHGSGPLTIIQREMIGVAVSCVNQCDY